MNERFLRLMMLTLGWVIGLLTPFNLNSCFNNSINNNSKPPEILNNKKNCSAGCQSSSAARISTATADSSVSSSLQPLEHSKHHVTANYRRRTANMQIVSDAFNPFHQYMSVLGSLDIKIHSEIPLWNSWVHYFEPYHNHMARFRDKEKVVFMEIGVQSGGKIPLMRKYFGPGLTYIGIDINPSTKMFETRADDDFTAHIEIGDSSDPAFLNSLKEKYPHVDIFLDDGGHTMTQQITAMRHMLPHVQPEGVYLCEDLGTSWQKVFGGVPNGRSNAGNPRFLNDTMVGFVHQSMDWFTAAIMRGKHSYYVQDIDKISNCKFSCADSDGDQPFWKTIPKQVKHIHYYHQIVVFEKGVTTPPSPLQTVGTEIPVGYSGEHNPVNWSRILKQIDAHFDDSHFDFQ